MFKQLKLAIGLAITATLVACGGGGDSASEPITAPTLNLKSAWSSYLKSNSSKNYTVSGTLDATSVGGSGLLIISFQSPVSVLAINPFSPFPGPTQNLSNVEKTTITNNSTLIINGTQNISSSSVEYYLDASGTIKMMKDLDDNEQTIVTSFSSLPSQVTSGSGGVLYTGTVFSPLGYTCGTETGTYSVSTESNTALIVTLTITQNTTNKQVGQCTTQTLTTQEKYRLTATGLTPVNFTYSGSIASGSVSLIF
jgi:hypothetical protein